MSGSAPFSADVSLHGSIWMWRRRERNKESARASRKKRKALLDNLADRVTRLAEETDRRRLAQAEVAVDAIDRRKAELVAAARAALAMAATPAAPSTPDMMTRGPSEDDTDSKLETAAAAAAALPALIRERFSMAGAERRALLDFALEHSLSVGVPHHQRLLVYLSEQPDSFFTTAEDRLARIEATKASLPDPAMDPAFAAAWGIPQPVKASATTASDASSSALAGSSSASSAESESPDLWGILSNELWLSSPSVAKLRHILKGSHARELGKLRRLIRTNRELRAAIADRATVSARLSAGIHSCLFPSQELAFNDFLSRNAERIRRLMPLTSRTRSTDAQAAAASRVAQTLRGTSAGSVEAELRAAVSVAQRAGSGGSVVVASTPTHELSA